MNDPFASYASLSLFFQDMLPSDQRCRSRDVPGDATQDSRRCAGAPNITVFFRFFFSRTQSPRLDAPREVGIVFDLYTKYHLKSNA